LAQNPFQINKPISPSFWLRIPDDGDRWFRAIVITIPRNDFHRGEVALDITEGKLFLRFDLWERQGANQEIVHAQDQGSPSPPL
jgi:hypothetical protein